VLTHVDDFNAIHCEFTTSFRAFIVSIVSNEDSTIPSVISFMDTLNNNISVENSHRSTSVDRDTINYLNQTDVIVAEGWVDGNRGSTDTFNGDNFMLRVIL